MESPEFEPQHQHKPGVVVHNSNFMPVISIILWKGAEGSDIQGHLKNIVLEWSGMCKSLSLNRKYKEEVGKFSI